MRKSSAELLGDSRLGKSLSPSLSLCWPSTLAVPLNLSISGGKHQPARPLATRPWHSSRCLASVPAHASCAAKCTDARTYRCTDVWMHNCLPAAQLVHSPSTIRQVELKLPVLIFPYFLSSFPSPACHYCSPLWTRSCSCSLPMDGPRG